jgi:hypothetical protein
MDHTNHALLADVVDGLIQEPELVASVLHVVLHPLAGIELATLEPSHRVEVVAALDATAILASSEDVSQSQLEMLFEPIKVLGIDGVGVFVQSLAECRGAPSGLLRGSVREQLRAKLDSITNILEADQRYKPVLEEFALLSAEAILADYERTASELYAANLLYSHERLLRHLRAPSLIRRIGALDARIAYS